MILIISCWGFRFCWASSHYVEQAMSNLPNVLQSNELNPTFMKATMFCLNCLQAAGCGCWYILGRATLLELLYHDIQHISVAIQNTTIKDFICIAHAVFKKLKISTKYSDACFLTLTVYKKFFCRKKKKVCFVVSTTRPSVTTNYGWYPALLNK